MPTLFPLLVIANAVSGGSVSAAAQLRDDFVGICVESTSLQDIEERASAKGMEESDPTSDDDRLRIIAPPGRNFPVLVVVPKAGENRDVVNCHMHDPAVERDELIAVMAGSFQSANQSENEQMIWRTSDFQIIKGREVEVSDLENTQKVLGLSIQRKFSD